MTWIKICGLSRREDIVFVNRTRPDFIGFILGFPKSRRNISPETASALRRELREDIGAVGVFVDRPVEEIVSVSERIGLDTVQLHGSEDAAYILALKERIRLPVWKAFRVQCAEDLREAEVCPADQILLDAGYGGGKAFDWSAAEDLRRPFILAGGLNADNAAGALRTLRPLGVDVSSGVETDGVKDEKKIAAFIAAVRKESV